VRRHKSCTESYQRKANMAKRKDRLKLALIQPYKEYYPNGAVTFGKTEKVRNDNEKSQKTAKTVNETVE
jgi:hypothetical protein